MNCRPGDLAVIVRATVQSNIGLIVKCVRLSHWEGLTRSDDGGVDFGPVWEVDAMLPRPKGLPHPWMLDSHLRPLRDNEGADETLSWCGKPATYKPAPAPMVGEGYEVLTRSA